MRSSSKRGSTETFFPFLCFLFGLGGPGVRGSKEVNKHATHSNPTGPTAD